MKIEPAKISQIIESNFSYLMPEFYQMQTEYMKSMNNIYNDLDAALVAMFLTNKYYQNDIKENHLSNNVSNKIFYQKNIFKVSTPKFKINEISNATGIPRETVRRKKNKLIKNKFIIFNKKKKSYSLNKSLIDKKILEPQIKISSKMLYNCCNFFSNKNIFSKELDLVSFKNDIEKKFMFYLPIFLNFQISYITQWRKFFDMECLFIVVLCALNTSTHIRRRSKNLNDVFDSKEIFSEVYKLNNKFGINSTSIADITNIPRTTILRKLAKLQKLNMLKKDKYKRYATEVLNNSENIKKTAYPNMRNTINLLGILISKCLETYTSKELKII